MANSWHDKRFLPIPGNLFCLITNRISAVINSGLENHKNFVPLSLSFSPIQRISAASGSYLAKLLIFIKFQKVRGNMKSVANL